MRFGARRDRPHRSVCNEPSARTELARCRALARPAGTLRTVAPTTCELRAQHPTGACRGLADVAGLVCGEWSRGFSRETKGSGRLHPDSLAAARARCDGGGVDEKEEGNGTTRRASTVTRWLASLATLHRIADALDPTRDEDVRAARRMPIRGRNAPEQKAPLHWADVERALAELGEELRDLRAKALIAVGYSTMARRAELRKNARVPQTDSNQTELLPGIDQVFPSHTDFGSIGEIPPTSTAYATQVLPERRDRSFRPQK